MVFLHWVHLLTVCGKAQRNRTGTEPKLLDATRLAVFIKSRLKSSGLNSFLVLLHAEPQFSDRISEALSSRRPEDEGNWSFASNGLAASRVFECVCCRAKLFVRPHKEQKQLELHKTSTYTNHISLRACL